MTILWNSSIVFRLGNGEINGKAMVLPTKSGVFRCRFSLKPIQWIFPWTFFSIFPSGNPEWSAPAPADIACVQKEPGQLQVIPLALIFVYYMDIQYIHIYIDLQTMIMIICMYIYIYISIHIIILYIYIYPYNMVIHILYGVNHLFPNFAGPLAPEWRPAGAAGCLWRTWRSQKKKRLGIWHDSPCLFGYI